MKRPVSKWSFVAAVVYFVSVVVTIFLAFDFDGYTNMTAWAILTLLTLPWSVVSILFLWTISHGAGLEVFALMYGAFGLVNALLLYLLFRTLKFKAEDSNGMTSAE